MFQEEISNAMFLKEVINVKDVSAAANLFLDNLYSLFNRHFPLRNVKICNDDKPWVKPSLKVLINDRDRAYKQGKTLKYLRLRDSVISHIIKLKSTFLSAASQDGGKTTQWRSINQLLNRKIRAFTDVDVNSIAVHFAAVHNRPRPTSFPDFDLEEETLHSEKLFLQINDVVKVLKSLKKGSGGPDGIPFWVLRENAYLLAPAIYHICQLSVSTGIVPTPFKKAFVCPIPKCKNPSPTDYRPISLLSITSKVLERIIIKKWLTPFSHEIDPYQFAFVPRKAQGTVSALTFIMHKIFSFLDTPGAVRLLMIDFTKAFDRLPHNVILKSLAHKGCSIELLTWIKSYLSSRSQCVKSNGKLSDWYETKSGVPQGSVLAPFLFAVSIDSLQPLFSNSLIVKFADDVCLLHFIRKNEDDRLLDELDHISTWCEENGLTLNTGKTKVMNFQTKQNIIFNPVIDKLSDTIINNTQSAKLLGIYLDSKLNWQQQIDYITSCIRKRVYILYALKQSNAHSKILTLAYESMIRSITTYAFPAWCNVADSRFDRLLKMEKRLCRIFNLKPKINLKQMCDKMCYELVEKCRDVNHPLHSIFEVSASRYSTRLGRTHRKIMAKTKRFKNSFIKYV